MSRTTSDLAAHEMQADLLRRFAAVGLENYLRRDLMQVLDLPSGTFIEVVLTDATKIPEARDLLARFESELKAKGEDVETLARALWTVLEVRLDTVPASVGRKVVGNVPYSATLQSGSERSPVSVEVTLRALERTAERFEMPPPDEVPISAELLVQVESVVRKFLEAQLAVGGTGYWDPKTKPVQVLNDAAVSYLLRESIELRQLRAAMDDFFGVYTIRDSLKNLREAAPRFKLRDAFDRVVPELACHFGGAYARGDRFLTSASELYDSLDNAERNQLKRHFLRNIERVDEGLKRQFPELF